MTADENRTLTTSDLADAQDADAPTSREADAPPSREGAAVATEPTPQLLAGEDAAGFESRWRQIQEAFVDEPRRSVEEADSLVADLMQRLASSFAEQRAELEAQWDRGDDVSTEDLRVALTRYRSFFQRLLAA